MGSCEGVHVVSIVAAADPDWSLVMLRVAGEREAIVRRRGAEVLAIGVDTVVLARAGKPCVARIFAPPTDDHAQPAPAANRSIVRTGPDSFALDRSARDALIEGAGELMRAVAVRPESQNGEVIGLRIATLKPGTPLDALGVRGGDVLLSLDGTPLISPDTMLQAYARVRTEEHVRLVVLRDGRQLQLDYEVR
jgi:general secretion pathway protein C